MISHTRFAPSPTGPLHLGHAFSALLAQDMAARTGGTFQLRMEDIDTTRSKPEWEAGIVQDLRWLGLNWPQPVLRQSQNLPAYAAALDILWHKGLLYPCVCKRRDVLAATSAPQDGGAHPVGPDGPVYPGTCRDAIRAMDDPRPQEAVLRLDMARAVPGLSAAFIETGAGPRGQTGRIALCAKTLITQVGDVVLARRDMGTSYHLSVVIDDAAQGITHVTRGTDLFDATQIHATLQGLLGLPTPLYHHHRLIRDETGKRLAKRDDARAIAKYRAEGATPQDIRDLVGLSPN